MWFEVAVAVVAIFAGALGSVTGLGIGTVLTPLFATRMETRLAVAVIAIPHLTGTAWRFWKLRHKVSRKILLSFGVASAAGGLTGALLHEVASSEVLKKIFGGVLIVAAILEGTGLAEKVKLGKVGSWVAGGVSGLFGGLVGIQGGLRTAAMFGFKCGKDAFVATAIAISLIVDVVRMPVYLVAEGKQVFERWPLIVIATAGALLGTWVGSPLLAKIPERLFRRLLTVVVFAVGIYVLVAKS
ncbi:MAG: sulfite exporter TauE/SafE family protein [Myxococcaceae bacterium]